MKRILLVLLILTVTSHAAYAAEECPKILSFDDGDADLMVDLEEHPLSAILEKDPAKNLVTQHPGIAMSAFQRAKSWAYARGVNVVPNPNYGGPVRVFPIFSDGVAEARKRRIIGQYRQIEAFVNYLDRGADGDGSRSKMPIFYGPPGTGKTEFLMILLEVSKSLQTHNPAYYNYTYEWHGLSQIPELLPFLNTHQLADGTVFEHPLRCPIGDSPLVLLPPDMQKNLIKMATPAVQKMIKVTPTPHLPQCPHCHKISRAILRHYAKTSGKAKLSDQDIVDFLGKHVTLKRHVIGRGGKIPKMNAEGKDVDYPGLFLAPNAFILTQFGPDHPLSYFLNGKIPSFHGGIGLLDEFFRNDTALRDMFLEVQENGVISRGGAPSVFIDAVFISASNTESIDAAKAQGTARAQIDRARLIPMYWEINPYLVGKTMLHMKNSTRVLQQSLETPPATSTPVTADGEEKKPEPNPVTTGDLDKLFPLPLRDQPFVGPDRRYKMWIASEDKQVHLSPHVLQFMAEVVAATRLVADPKLAEEVGNYKVTNSVAFRDIVTRLKILMRQYTITPSEARELAELSEYLQEGNAGISTRDAANVWLTEAIAEAQKPGNGNCVTPILAKRIFQRLMQEKAIQCPDNATRLKWLNILDVVAHNFLVPSLQDDVNEAIGQDSGSAETIYDDLFNEIEALQLDAAAREYQAPNGETRLIDLARLKEIEEIYVQENRRPLARGEIIQWHSRPAGAKVEVRRHEGLMKAIRRYLAAASKKLVAFGDLLRVGNTGEGTSDAKSKYASAAHTMIHKHGYCERCIRSALELANQSEAATQKPANQQP